MSDLTIGKIVNNSVTLVLSSSDQDGFGEKVVTANNFTVEDDDIPAGQYNILAHSTDAVTLTHTPSGGVRTNKLYKNTFHFMKNGPVSGQTDVVTSNTFVTGDLYVIKTQGTVGGNFFTAGANDDPIFDITSGESGAEPNAGLVFRCIRQPASDTFNGEAIKVGDAGSATSGDLAIVLYIRVY
jgi:hypothetical protein